MNQEAHVLETFAFEPLQAMSENKSIILPSGSTLTVSIGVHSSTDKKSKGKARADASTWVETRGGEVLTSHNTHAALRESLKRTRDALAVDVRAINELLGIIEADKVIVT